MSNQNNDRNPPQPSPKNIQVTPKTQGPIGAANTAGNVHGGVGNTYNTVFNVQGTANTVGNVTGGFVSTNINVIQAQAGKECVEKEIRKLRNELTTKENEEKIGKLKVEVGKFQQQAYGEREDAQSIKKKKCELMKEVQHHNDEITRLENDIQGLKEKILDAEKRLGALKLTVEDTSNTLKKQVQDLMQHLERYVTNVKAEKERIAELYRLMEKIEAEQAKQIEDEQRAKEKLQRKMQKIEAEQAKQKLQFEDEQREKEELQRKMQNIEVKQAKQFEDYRKEREELQRQMQILLKVIEEKDKVLEEKDKDMRQLKDARAAAERMVSWGKPRVQEPQHEVQNKKTQT